MPFVPWCSSFHWVVCTPTIARTGSKIFRKSLGFEKVINSHWGTDPGSPSRFENGRFENRGVISYLRRGVNTEALRALGAGLARERGRFVEGVIATRAMTGGSISPEAEGGSRRRRAQCGVRPAASSQTDNHLYAPWGPSRLRNSTQLGQMSCRQR